MSRCEYSGVDIALAYVPRRVFFLVYISMPRAAPSCGEEGEKQAGKKARFNGRNEFPATWSAIASALFSAPFVNTPLLRRSLVGLRWNNTDHVDLSTSSHHLTIGLLKFMRFYAANAIGRKTGRRKNIKNKILTSFGCEMSIPRTVIEPRVQREATG